MIKSWESRRRWRSMYRVWRPGTKAERTFLVRRHHWRRLSTRWEWVRGMCARCKKGRHPLEALSWVPPGKRHRGRPLGTWWRTIEDEMETAGKTWNELRWLAQDRSEWKKFVGALCSPQRGSEDWLTDWLQYTVKKIHRGLLQCWLYCREHLKYIWNVYCDVTSHNRDLHTTEVTEQIIFVLFKDTNCLITNLKHRCSPRSVLRTASRSLFEWCEDLTCDWLQHNKHSRHILGVHGNIISTVKPSQYQTFHKIHVSKVKLFY